MTRRHTISPRRVFFDLETGGLNASRHPIIQIAAVAFDIHWQELERFEVKLKFDEADADPEALKKVCYSKHLWAKHAVSPITAYERFCYFLREHATVDKLSQAGKPYHVARLFAHNAKFDSEFLWSFHDRLRKKNKKLFLPADRHVICTLQTALLYFETAYDLEKPPDYKLGTLCDYFGIPFSANEAHDALYDCVATARLFHFSALMRELTYRNGGTFVAVTERS